MKKLLIGTAACMMMNIVGCKKKDPEKESGVGNHSEGDILPNDQQKLNNYSKIITKYPGRSEEELAKLYLEAIRENKL